jgi:uncharacterized SAM-binding protein YcdF (DUF218 family)
VTLLLSPLTLLLFASMLAMLAAARHWRRMFIVAASTMLLSLFAMTPWFANRLVGAIERRADASAGECGRIDAVVLLSGGLERAPLADDDFAALTPETLARLFAFAKRELASDVSLVIAGGGPHALAESQVIEALLRRIDPQLRVALRETRSATTWENASAVADLLPPPRRIALATGALHLPRARRAFEAMGFEVCAWPLNRRYIAATGAMAFFPQSSSLRKTEAALHEIVGDFVYRWRASDVEPSTSE